MRSDAHADRIIDIGESVHENLLAQNQQLSGIRGVVANIASTLGVSRSVMKTIDRKVTEEKWLVYAGMVVMLLIVYVWWMYWR